jgi:sugar phosphate isomerase/epimerase
MHIAAFPKCYLDDIALHHTLSLFQWIEMAKPLGAEGLEMYSGFFTSFEPAYLDSVGEALQQGGFAMPMLCCSPDFTHPDPGYRRREIDKEISMIQVARHLGGPGVVCRVLSGQRYPQVGVEEGIEWVVEALQTLIPIAKEYDVVLGLENHYKDGFWHYPEFAQKMEIFLQIVDAIPKHRHFGVQYDPSNAIVAGDDPLELLARVAGRVVSVHASDRYLAPGASLDALRQADGALGYATDLRHGITGQGLNDYDAIFRILSAAGYHGWISIEDGMNGMDEMLASINYLKAMRARYYPNEGQP